MPLGKANVKRSGTDVTLVCYSRAVLTCLEAARKLSEEGIFAEVLDLCTLRPLDTDAVLSSVGKTGRLVMVQESPDFGDTVLRSSLWRCRTPGCSPYEGASSASQREGLSHPVPERA